MKLTITDVRNYTTKKDGGPIVDNKGRPKMRTQIKTVEKGNEMLSGFVYKELHVGDVIDAKIEQEMYNGQPQLRFSIIPSTEQAAVRAQNTSETQAELRSHTVLLRSILEELEKLNRNLSLEKDIGAIRGETPTFDAKKVVDEEDFGDADRDSTDYADGFPIADEDLPSF